MMTTAKEIASDSMSAAAAKLNSEDSNAEVCSSQYY